MNRERHTPRRAPFKPAGSRTLVYSVRDRPVLAAVASSRASTPVSAPNRIAASVTVRAIGPAGAWLWAIGAAPDPATKPRGGLIPPMPQHVGGGTNEPSRFGPNAP